MVADSYMLNGCYPSKQNEYTDVQVGDVSYEKTFREREVLHLRLNHVNIKPVLDGLYTSYCRLITAAMKRVEGMMDKVVEGFEKQLDQLFQGDTMDITADVDVLEQMLARDGLTGEQLRL